MLAGEKIVLGIQLEAPEVDGHPDMLGGPRHRRNENDEGDQQDVAQRRGLVFRQWRDGGREGQRRGQDRQPRHPLQPRHKGAPEEIPLGNDACQQAEGEPVDEERQRHDDGEDDGACQPVRKPEALGANFVHKVGHAPGARVQRSIEKSRRSKRLLRLRPAIQLSRQGSANRKPFSAPDSVFRLTTIQIIASAATSAAPSQVSSGNARSWPRRRVATA